MTASPVDSGAGSMNLFELRYAVESAVPWWTPLAVVAACLLTFWALYRFDEWQNRRRSR